MEHRPPRPPAGPGRPSIGGIGLAEIVLLSLAVGLWLAGPEPGPEYIRLAGPHSGLASPVHGAPSGEAAADGMPEQVGLPARSAPLLRRT